MTFRYLRDPLFLFSLFLYFLNRLVLKPLIHKGLLGAFLHGSLNDVLCIPFWVPIMVWMMRKLKMRTSDAKPQAAEILITLLVWSWWFEIVLPNTAYFRRVATSDPSDIFCYTLGAFIAAVFWNSYYSEKRIVPLRENAEAREMHVE